MSTQYSQTDSGEKRRTFASNKKRTNNESTPDRSTAGKITYVGRAERSLCALLLHLSHPSHSSPKPGILSNSLQHKCATIPRLCRLASNAIV